ncbi:MAG: Gfo/Idh/MocA family oxidoreductase [Candidatus Hydrogenedentes bacterium]|nr:Gfo/Idh/MocA family oxidoreductase [Candidatus Hydrogenedentota bacterium]
MSPIRVGVAGVGHLGYHHARIYASMEGVELVGVADPDVARRTKSAEDFTVPAFSDVHGLIEAGVDAVSIATPTVAHHDTAVALLQAGVHVLVEKPIAPTIAEAEVMVMLAKTHGRLLQVGHIERFNGAVLAFTQAITAPKFIECHRLSPFPGRGTDVSVVLDLMIHDLDIVLSLDSSEIVSLDAMGVAVFSSSEDIANVRLRFASGCVANLTSSRVSMDRMRKIRIFEENAYLSTDYSAQEVIVYRKKPGPIPENTNPMEHIDIEPLPVRKEEPLKLELESFITCVREKRRPVVSGEDGVRALRVAEEVMRFIRDHGGATRA